ncbi:MAG: single-stranded DNA-binding protein, partial [Propionibacteriaceae bacterium]|nr:single-stranded DNA-binding protein [Propionibacteriaceae bacterium]
MDITVTLTGNLGADPEFRQTAAGLSIATFRVAVTPRWRRDNDWVDAPTTWITVTCFRTLATNAISSLRRGDPVLVQGRLRTSVWTSADGQSHDRLVLEATAVGHDLNRGTSHFTRLTDRDQSVTEAEVVASE